MTNMRPQNRRRNVLINPRFQVGIGLVFTAIVVLGGAFFAWLVYRDAKAALWDASMQGHFQARTPYEIVGESFVRHLVALFAAVLAASVAAFFLVSRMIRNGIGRVVSSLEASVEGDLSTPTAASGMEEIVAFGRQLDEVRQSVLLRLGEIRDEAARLDREAVPEDVFRARWEELKRKIGGLVP